MTTRVVGNQTLRVAGIGGGPTSRSEPDRLGKDCLNIQVSLGGAAKVKIRGLRCSLIFEPSLRALFGSWCGLVSPAYLPSSTPPGGVNAIETADDVTQDPTWTGFFSHHSEELVSANRASICSRWWHPMGHAGEGQTFSPTNASPKCAERGVGLKKSNMKGGKKVFVWTTRYCTNSIV